MNRKDTVASRVDWRRKKKGHRRSRTIHMIHTHTKKLNLRNFMLNSVGSIAERSKVSVALDKREPERASSPTSLKHGL